MHKKPFCAAHRGLGVVALRHSLRFDRRAYIEMSFDSRQLKAIRRYMRLNAARALWKARHRDRFVRFANIGHAILDPARTWSAMGNLTLLGAPFLLHVRLTLKNTTPHVSARDMRRDPAAARFFRANCLEMNDLAAALCAKAQTLA